MLTYNRYDEFKKSFRCFLRQDYSNLECVVVNSGDDDYKKRINNYLKNQKCNTQHITVDKQMLGNLRNIGLDNCNGEFVIIWDDDDIYSSDRVSKQIDLCLKAHIDATVLRNFEAYYMGNKFRCSNIRGLEGSILFRKTNVRYSEMNQGEDTDFIKKLKEKDYNIAIIDEDYSLYRYCYHKNNTVDDNHFYEMIEKNPPLR
jgi:glycosyltransferase involved in cell wall biosynthesis